MNRFVEECRREWSRLGVPEPTANEMAADLEADLSEAASEGVSPEEVLGNGYFDAKSFAAAWAHERGVVNEASRAQAPGSSITVRSLTLALGTLVCLVVGAVGLAILVSRRMGAVSIAAMSLRRSIPRPATVFAGPDRFDLPGTPLIALGIVILLAGLLGAAVTLWIWKPWSAQTRSTRSMTKDADGPARTPTYLDVMWANLRVIPDCLATTPR